MVQKGKGRMFGRAWIRGLRRKAEMWRVYFKGKQREFLLIVSRNCKMLRGG